MEGSDLSPKRSDYLISLLKASVGSIPVAGSFISEMVSYVIPNQQIDRIVKFTKQLEQRLIRIELYLTDSKNYSDHFVEMMEEVLRQASRSTSDDRRDYLASLVVRSLTMEDERIIESRHLLRILNEINDIEVIWLRSYLCPLDYTDEFLEKYQDILQLRSTLSNDEEEYNKACIQMSYKQHLERLGLLRPKYQLDRNTKQPVFDKKSGLKAEGYEITEFGRLLIKYIGLDPYE